MITLYQGEQRGGRIKLTTDIDCLSPEIIRLETRVFPDMDAVKNTVRELESRGFKVCVDTETVFYETETPDWGYGWN